MRRGFLISAALVLAASGGSSLVAGQAIAASPAGLAPAPAASSRPGVLLVCNGSSAQCPAIPRAADGQHLHLAAALADQAASPAQGEPLFDRALTRILTGLLPHLTDRGYLPPVFRR